MKPRRRRGTSLLIAAGLILLLGGCVFQHLAEFQAQLADFDHNFQVDTSHGMAVRAAHPLLEPDDLRFLGLRPTRLTTRADGEDWQVVWVSETPVTAPAAPTAIEFALGFAADKLTTATIDRRYWSPEVQDFFYLLVHHAGEARLEKWHRRLTGILHLPPPQRLTVAQVAGFEAILGPPAEVRETPSLRRHFYRFASRSQWGIVSRAELTFSFDATGTLREFQVKLPAGQLRFLFEPEPPAGGRV